jgi:thiol:disulfide interchange protein DsbA
MFENEVGSKLKKEFGDSLEIRMIGFPVMRGKLPTAFEMYEQAQKMGKGTEMKAVLFRSIHKERIHIFDRKLRAILIQEIGLSVKDFEAGMATGEPYKLLKNGEKWGARIGVTHTPTIVLNGNIRVDNIDINNLRIIIKGILKQDKAR